MGAYLTFGTTNIGANTRTEKMRVTANGNVGIGTTAPVGIINTSGTSGIYVDRTENNTAVAAHLLFRRGNASGAFSYIGTTGDASNGVADLTFATASIEKMRITSAGNVGIGTTVPAHPLHVIGTAGLSTGTAWTNTSDRRLKDIHGKYEYGLDEILKLDVVKFSYKVNNPLGLPSDKEIVGFVAQDVQKVIPEAIVRRDDGYLELNVDPIHWAMVNAFKDVDKKFSENIARFEIMKNGLEELRADMKEAKRAIASLEDKLEKIENENKKKDLEINQLKNYLCQKDKRAPFCK
jgi:predicted nuclease with TOPRIM domain